MYPERPLSDNKIRLICSTIGLISFTLNLVVLVSLLKLRLMFARNIFIILALLQVFYLFQNLHFTIFYIPFIYMPVSGGYCIGLLCERYRISFLAHHSLCIFLIVNICGLFALLLFYRYQNLMGTLSRFKLGRRSGIVAPVILVMGINALPVRFSIRSLLLDERDQGRLLRKLCPDCDWVERHRNYGVQDSEDVIINGSIILVTVAVYATYGFACSGHICRTIARHRWETMSYGCRIKISQTLQSLVQTGLFALFLAVPILLFMTVPFHDFEDDSVVLLPSIFLFSLNSLAHTVIIIVTTRPIRETAMRMMRQGLLLDPTISELTLVSSTTRHPPRSSSFKR
ncbi:hypothetical protein PRIPAC_79877 [Pristionchus pacificus]|uniref:G protein-coupled receptor n=1 Tax=Pristionchus pacificus TaxID=54126 RepID=A0A2A6CK08_PRIPA|nr:hypothetical protein PRIPAC_79877 [Pristionchus pacificus]|eukprot:PDM78440.1 G protein-coupled receptor [Pristionchus pacificus]